MYFCNFVQRVHQDRTTFHETMHTLFDRIHSARVVQDSSDSRLYASELTCQDRIGRLTLCTQARKTVSRTKNERDPGFYSPIASIALPAAEIVAS